MRLAFLLIVLAFVCILLFGFLQIPASTKGENVTIALQECYRGVKGFEICLQEWEGDWAYFEVTQYGKPKAKLFEGIVGPYVLEVIDGVGYIKELE